MRIHPFLPHLQTPETNDVLAVAHAALDAVHARTLIRQSLQFHDNNLHINDCFGNKATYNLGRFRRIFVLGAGKASAHMAQALLTLLPKENIADGVVITKKGHGMPCGPVRCLEADHPIPGQATLEATEQLLELANQAGRGDLVIFCLSGGASSLLERPLPGVSIEDIQMWTSRLLHTKTSIQAMNRVRTAFSAVKGGGLAQAIDPAELITLVISDVIGDQPEVIGSGPTVIPASRRLGQVPDRDTLEALLAEPDFFRSESPKPKNYFVIGNIMAARTAASQAAQRRGYPVQLIEQPYQGMLENYVDFWRRLMMQNVHASKMAVIAGSECVLDVPEKTCGTGGRNQHLALQMTARMANYPRPWTFLSLGTDGNDGQTQAAGALINYATFFNAAAMGFDVESHLKEYDSGGFFQKAGGQVITGPTGTNVNDLQILILG